ncbi:MAG: PAS domain-containing sensor histidine kinase [Candidatus Micrarchaeia archaeon]
MELTTLNKKIENYYPKYAEHTKLGKRMPFFDRMLKPRTIAGCKMKAHYENKFAQAMAKTANAQKIWQLSTEYGLIMEHVRDMVSLTGMDGSFVSISKSFEKTLGYTDRDLDGRTIFDLVHPDDLATVKAAFEKGVKGGEGLADVRVMRNPKIYGENSYIWSEVQGNVVFEENGVPICAVMVSRDITEYKRMQHDVEQMVSKLKALVEEKDQLVQAKDKFFSIIAHDLKSPFNSLLGFSEILNEQYDSLSDGERREYISCVNDASHNAYSLLEQMLEWSRLQNGKFDEPTKALNLRAVVDKAISPLLPAVEAKHIALINSIAPSQTIQGKEMMLGRVIANLVSNAIKFTSDNGMGIITVRVSSAGGAVNIEVMDNGVGIAQDRLPLLFTMSEKTTTNGTNGEKGTGLGLPMVAEMVKPMGGEIQVASRPGKGTTFTVALPSSQD